KKTANLALDDFDVQKVPDNPELWEKVVRKLRVGLHVFAPPVAQASRPASDTFSASIEAALDRADQLNWGPGAAEPLTGEELAGRMATFLWNSQPDDTLLNLARSGKLRSPATVAEQVRRMIADGRSSALLSDFFAQWLHLKNVATIKPE